MSGGHVTQAAGGYGVRPYSLQSAGGELSIPAAGSPEFRPYNTMPEGGGLPAPADPIPFQRTAGSRPVDRLRPLIWPPRFRELPAYFEKYTPVALFDLPGWRFIRVPMNQGGFFAMGYHAQGGRVTHVAYAIPGTANEPPPRQFNRYRFHYGRDGQGYWTMGQRA